MGGRAERCRRQPTPRRRREARAGGALRHRGQTLQRMIEREDYGLSRPQAMARPADASQQTPTPGAP